MRKPASKFDAAIAIGNVGHPNSWLRELARLRKSRWDMGHSVRAALALGLPWAMFLATGSAAFALWIYFGALRAALSETQGDFSARFKSILVGPIIGALGFLATPLASAPWGMTVAVMAGAGYIAAIASSYSALLSAGVTQALVVASLSIGLPQIASGWQPPLLYLSGVALYVALLGIERLCSSGRKQNDAAMNLIAALGDLAARRATATGDDIEQPEVEEARRVVTLGFSALGSLSMCAAAQHFGRGDEADRLATIMARSDAVFVAIMASHDRGGLQEAARVLHSVASGSIPSVKGGDDALVLALASLLTCLGARTASPNQPVTFFRQDAPHRLRGMIDQLVPSRAVMISAASVALCMGIAYAAKWLDDATHWFWIPLTVSLVMKPDLGSVFARAILRVAGTIIGAVIGGVILLLVPNGVWLAVPLGILAGFLPFAAQRSFGLLAVAVTPIILITVSTLDKAPIDMGYVVPRIIDTAIGGMIVLVFGYFIWPRTHYKRLSADFYQAKKYVADYILAAVGRDETATDNRLPTARRRAYQNLMDMRMHLRTALAEPPPASDEAAAWFPLIATAARICDHVTIYATSAAIPVPDVDARALKHLANYVAATPEERRHLASPSHHGCSAHLVELACAIERELQHMDRLRDEQSFLAMSRAQHIAT